MVVEIQYIDGTSETVEAKKMENGAYYYKHSSQMFFVHLENSEMMIPREFVKSIRYVEVE